MQAKFLLDLQEKHLRFTAAVDSFPAFEAYATINDGAGVEIFRLAPPTGNTVMNLPGSAGTKVDAAVLYDPGNGIFAKRWTAGLPKFTPLSKRIDLHQVRGFA